jgi:hypothetical protein
MADIRIKRGASLMLNFDFSNADGTPFNLQGVSLTLTIADPRGNMLVNAQLDVLAPNWSFVLTGVAGQASASIYNTGVWPEGLAQGDLLISANGQSMISQSFGVRVERPVVQVAPDPAPYNPVLAP